MNPGTPGFMSPEQAAGGRVGPSSDVFSFGAVLAFAATAKEPFRSGGVETVLQQVRATHTDQWLGDLIEACLRREQDRRPSASDLLTRLDGASLAQGARWLPADLTVAVAHRAAQAQHVLDDRTARPWSEPPMLDQSRMAEETLDPAGTSGDPPPRRVSRRGLVFGGAAVLLAAGLTTEAVVLARNRNPGLPPAKASTSPSPSLPPSPTPAPVAVSRWKAKVSDYYPDLLTAGGLVLAHAPGVLRALDPKTGKTRWIHHSWDSNHVGVAGDTLFLYDHFQGSGLLVAVQAASGADRWKYDPPPNWVPSYPVAGASLACFGSTTSITALNLSDGRRRWTAPVNSEFGIAVGGDAVVGVSRTTVSGLDAASGRTRWTYPADFGHNPEITQGLVVVADGPGTVHALRADNGQLVWKRDLGSTVYGCFGFGETGGLLYFGTADGKAHALRTTTGEVTWERQLTAGGPRNQWNALGFSGGMLYVGGADRTVYALDGADGRTKWTYPADVTVRTSAPVAVAGLVFIGTGDGSVVALSPPAGGQRAGA
jgi:outer membrane protein assembly factor BamB